MDMLPLKTRLQLIGSQSAHQLRLLTKTLVNLTLMFQLLLVRYSYAAGNATCEMLQLSYIAEEIGMSFPKPAILEMDNTAAEAFRLVS